MKINELTQEQLDLLIAENDNLKKIEKEKEDIQAELDSFKNENAEIKKENDETKSEIKKVKEANYKLLRMVERKRETSENALISLFGRSKKK